MDGDFGSSWLILVVLAVFMVGSFFLRRRRKEGTPFEMVVSLRSELEYNRRLMETFKLRRHARKFKMGSWRRNNTKLDFLDQPLQTTLTSTFDIAEDINRQIDTARKSGSTSYLANINMDRIEEPLAKSQQALEEWFQAHLETEGPPRRPVF